MNSSLIHPSIEILSDEASYNFQLVTSKCHRPCSKLIRQVAPLCPDIIILGGVERLFLKCMQILKNDNMISSFCLVPRLSWIAHANDNAFNPFMAILSFGGCSPEDL